MINRINKSNAIAFIFALLISASPLGAHAASIITTVAGNGATGYSGDNGIASSTELDSPWGVAVDDSGNIYIADTDNNVIRKVDNDTGIITTVAGDGAAGYSGDNGLATSAELNFPDGIAVDTSGNIYIADFSNNVIRKVDHTTGIITTVAGGGTGAHVCDNKPATSAYLFQPMGVAVDGSGNIYIAQGTDSVICKVDHATGIITTVAGDGTQGYSGDNGLATSATLNHPMGVAVDGDTNIYITDIAIGSSVIRKVDHVTGIITTVAGDGAVGYSGDNGPATSATLYLPTGVAVDCSGNIYIADSGNAAIRKVDYATDIITTVAGIGTAGYSGDNGPATSAMLNTPIGVAVDSIGNIYIADSSNNRIRMVKLSSGVGGVPCVPMDLNATSGDTQVSLNWTASTGATSYNVYEGTTAGGESSTPVATGITGTSTSITGLVNGKTYFFTVVAVNANGASSASVESSATPNTVSVTPSGGGGSGGGGGRGGGGIGPETLLGLIMLVVGFSYTARRGREKLRIGSPRQG